MPLDRKTAPLQAGPIKGRGAASWVPGRYEKTRVEGADDGWGSLYPDDEAASDPRPETRVFAKTNAAGLLRRELAKPGYVVQPIALGMNTDAYQPIERTQRITRQC